MKKNIVMLLEHLECDDSKTSELRDLFMSLNTLSSGKLDLEERHLQDTIKEINTQNHKCIHTIYFFLGCIYYEQNKYKKALEYLAYAGIGSWHSRTNKSLTKWLIALICFDQKDFPKARLELAEATQLLETTAAINSLRAGLENRSRQAIRQGMAKTKELLASEPFFHFIPSTSENNPDSRPSGDSSAKQTGEPEENTKSNSAAYQETYTTEDVSVLQSTESSFEIPVNTNINSINQTQTDGYLSIQSLPVYEQNISASKPGYPLSTLEKIGFAETQIIILEDKLYRIHSMKRKDNEIKITQNTELGWVKVVGKSMNCIPNRASIENGDFVLSKFANDADENDIVLASLEDPQTMQIHLVVKRYRKELQVLQSETTEEGADYEDINLNNKNNAKIIGIVLAVAKLFNR